MATTAEQDAATDVLIAQLIQIYFEGIQDWSHEVGHDFEPANMEIRHDDSQIQYSFTDGGGYEQAGWTRESPIEHLSNEDQNETTKVVFKEHESAHQETSLKLGGLKNASNGKDQGTEDKMNDAENDPDRDADDARERASNTREGSQDIDWTEQGSAYKGKGRAKPHPGISWNAVKGNPDGTDGGSYSVYMPSTDPGRVWDSDHDYQSTPHSNKAWRNTSHGDGGTDETLYTCYRSIENDVYLDDEEGGNNYYNNYVFRIPFPVPSEEEMMRQKAELHEILLEDDVDLWSFLGELII